MSIRPSWVNVDIEGKATPLASGPKAKDGWMTADFFVRENGESVKSIRVECIANHTVNILTVYAPDGTVLFTQTTNL